MRILKEGIQQDEIIYDGTCRQCECSIECEADEVITDMDGYTYVHCPNPTCDCCIVVSCEIERTVKAALNQKKRFFFW